MQRLVRRIEVEHDLPRRSAVRFQKELYEQAFNRRSVMSDLVIPRWLFPRELQPVLVWTRRWAIEAKGLPLGGFVLGRPDRPNAVRVC